jgi:hypothetical protein
MDPVDLDSDPNLEHCSKVNTEMPKKSQSGIGIPASGQSGTAGHGLMVPGYCPALVMPND